MGVKEIERFLEQWQMDAPDLRRMLLPAPTPRERERWYALWLLAQGWTAPATAEALERDPSGPAALIFEQAGGSPRPRRSAAGGVEGGCAGIARQVRHRPGQLEGGPSVCLGPVRHSPEQEQLPEVSAPARIRPEGPKKRLVKADERKREAFVPEYPVMADGARGSGDKIVFADEAHFREDAALRGKWVLKGSRPWWIRPVPAVAGRPATTRPCAWRPVRWSVWNWTVTATPELRPLSLCI